MEQSKLNYEGHVLGLRKIGEGVYEPKNKSVFSKIISDNPLEVNSSISALLVVKNKDALRKKIKEIEEFMGGKNWAFWIADISKDFECFRVLEELSKSSGASMFMPFKIKAQNEESAVSILRTLSSTSKKYFESEILFHEDTEEFYDLESFCFVCTKELMKEGAVLIESLKLFYSLPIYLVCDEETKRYFKSLGFTGITYKLDAEGDILEEIKSSHFKTLYSQLVSPHRVECIFQKMHSMNFALENHSNTFFLDTDIVLVNEIDKELNKNVMLSPHYNGVKRYTNSLDYGLFNAGYVFCADKSFPDHWKHLYLTRSKFYEQECMSYICEEYDIGIFDESHNWGFWRPHFKVPEDIKSFHLHLTDGIYTTETALIQMNDNIKGCFYKYLFTYSEKPKIEELSKKIKRIL
tara:strand:+ start:3115 stop:4338 length:1224 start_codon:yes stop_codon:yes gene_type:complete